MSAITFPTDIPQPSLQTPTTVKDPSMASEFVNGMKVTRRRYTRILRAWTLEWNYMTDTQLSILLTFYQTVGGGAAGFQWSDEFGNNYTVRFAGDLEHSSVNGNGSKVSCKIEEV